MLPPALALGRGSNKKEGTFPKHSFLAFHCKCWKTEYSILKLPDVSFFWNKLFDFSEIISFNISDIIYHFFLSDRLEKLLCVYEGPLPGSTMDSKEKNCDDTPKIVSPLMSVTKQNTYSNCLV